MSKTIEPKKFVQGSCYCNAIQFQIELPTEFCSHCHCSSCRRSHGAAFVTWTSVPLSRFKFLMGQDKIKKYNSSPAVKWCFCENCGTSMLYEHDGTPDKIYITVSSIDGEITQLPDSHVSYEEHASWLDVYDNLPKYRGKTLEAIELA